MSWPGSSPGQKTDLKIFMGVPWDIYLDSWGNNPFAFIDGCASTMEHRGGFVYFVTECHAKFIVRFSLYKCRSSRESMHLSVRCKVNSSGVVLFSIGMKWIIRICWNEAFLFDEPGTGTKAKTAAHWSLYFRSSN